MLRLTPRPQLLQQFLIVMILSLYLSKVVIINLNKVIMRA